MTNEEIVSELEDILKYQIGYGGIEVVPATRLVGLLNKLKTKGSE